MHEVIEPTIGRIVWFWKWGRSWNAPNAQPEAAIVTYVNNSRSVNLTVFNEHGHPRGMTGVELCQPNDSRPASGGFCEWMPYQIGQAKKHGDIKSEGWKKDVVPDSLTAGDAAAEAAQKPNTKRVSLEDMKKRIVREHYYSPPFAPHITVCLLVLDNGYVLDGMSAPADPTNFDAALGRQFAFEGALRKLWPLEGYLLREQSYRRSIADKEFDRAGMPNLKEPDVGGV